MWSCVGFRFELGRDARAHVHRTRGIDNDDDDDDDDDAERRCWMRIDGGVSRNAFILQLMAELANEPIVR